MAYRKKSRGKKTGSRRVSSRRTYKSRAAPRKRGARVRSGGGTTTLRIVIEQPGSSLARPDLQAERDEKPKKGKF